MLAENRFLAARDGVAAEFIDPAHGDRRPVAEQVDALLAVLRPHAEALGCGAELAGVAGLMECTGAGAQRELAHDGIDAVVPALAARFSPLSADAQSTTRLAHALAAGQAVEALVELVEPEPVGQQAVDGQAPLAVEGDELGDVAGRDRRAEVGAAQRPLLGDEAHGRDRRASGSGPAGRR